MHYFGIHLLSVAEVGCVVSVDVIATSETIKKSSRRSNYLKLCQSIKTQSRKKTNLQLFFCKADHYIMVTFCQCIGLQRSINGTQCIREIIRLMNLKRKVLCKMLYQWARRMKQRCRKCSCLHNDKLHSRWSICCQYSDKHQWHPCLRPDIESSRIDRQKGDLDYRYDTSRPSPDSQWNGKQGDQYDSPPPTRGDCQAALPEQLKRNLLATMSFKCSRYLFSIQCFTQTILGFRRRFRTSPKSEADKYDDYPLPHTQYIRFLETSRAITSRFSDLTQI